LAALTLFGESGAGCLQARRLPPSSGAARITLSRAFPALPAPALDLADRLRHIRPLIGGVRLMAENTGEVLVGAAVLVAAAAFVVFAAQGAGMTSDPGSYELRASFRSVDGIRVGTDVRLAGVKVGAITALALNPQTFFADATVSVPSDIILPDDSAILISSEGLLGGNFVELVPGGSTENLAPGDEILDTQGAVSLINLLMKFVGGKADPAAPAAGDAAP